MFNLYKIASYDEKLDGINFYTLEGGKDGDKYTFTESSDGLVQTGIPQNFTLVFLDTHHKATKADIIRRFYTVDSEMKVINKGITSVNDSLYIEYRNIVDNL
jgi:hypothetical protein